MDRKPPETLTDEQYRIVAEKLLSHIYSEHARVAAAQAEMSKWMIASLLVINGGAMVALGGMKDAPRLMLLGAMPCFMLGVIAAVFCGLKSWENAAKSKRLLFGRADPSLLYDRGRWPQSDEAAAASIAKASIDSTRYGMASLACFAAGCVVGGTLLAMLPAPSAAVVKVQLSGDDRPAAATSAGAAAGSVAKP